MSRTQHPLVVVIEDHADTRLMLELLLQNSFTVLSFDSSEGALTGLVGQSPDLLVIDLGMPNINGEQLVATLKRNMPATPAVAFTGFPRRHDLMLAAGFDAVVQKPEVDSLVEVIFRMTTRSKKKAS
jgi:CheY-like chemotaxis protein